MEYIKLINEHLHKARKKHPNFVKHVIYNRNHSRCTTMLECSRDELADIEDGYNTLRTELCEIFEAYTDCRYTDAISECFDLIAAILRLAFKIHRENVCKHKQ